MVAIGKEVRGFWSSIRKLFGANPKPVVAKPAAKSKKSEFVSVDETQVKVDIVKNLTEFFRLQEQLAEHIREEEEKSRTVFDPDQNHMEAALKRVMAQQEMERLVVQIRECMVYQSPPEMGALYSSVFEMREVIAEEQEQARLKQKADERYKSWLQQQKKGRVQMRIAVLLVALFLVGYLHLWLQILRQNNLMTPAS